MFVTVIELLRVVLGVLQMDSYIFRCCGTLRSGRPLYQVPECIIG